MKQEITTSIKTIMSDRWLAGLIVFNIIFAIIVVIVLAAHIKPRETQVITQYSAFGITSLYRDYWYTLWFYALLEVVAVVGHSILAVKLVKLERCHLGLALAWGTIGFSAILLLLALPILRIASFG